MQGTLTGLPNAQLLERVRELIQRGNAVEAELLAHLAELDARQLYLEVSRDFVEFDHAEAWAWTKTHSIDRITLRCRAHNQQRARSDFGEPHMARFHRRRGDDPPSTGFESSSP